MRDFPKTLVVTGPTATGKTALAVWLAREFSGEIVSVDSRQVFRGMDLGTGKDLAEYGEVSHHLIDVADPGEEFDLHRFTTLAGAAWQDVARRGRLPILAGGSTLYLDALLRGYALPGSAPDPALRAELDTLTLAELNDRLDRLNPAGLAGFRDRDNRLRVRRAIEIARETGALPAETQASAPGAASLLVLGVYYPRAEVRRRIEERLDARLAAGLIDEVAALHRGGVSWARLERFGLEYRHVAEYLQAKVDYPAMRSALLDRIRQFAKRQDIWFRKMEREGLEIHWLPGGDREAARRLTAAFLKGEALPPCGLRMSEVYYGPQSSRPESGG